jgi:large conductance mechanosensitive channel
MVDGFKKFILRGNVVDLAVGVIIGAAFGGVVKSMVEDVITPIIGLAGGIPDFSSFKAGPVRIGTFINAILNFLIQAAVVYFVIVLPVSKLLAKHKEEPKPAPAPTAEEKLLEEIRDILKAKG